MKIDCFGITINCFQLNQSNNIVVNNDLNSILFSSLLVVVSLSGWLVVLDATHLVALSHVRSSPLSALADCNATLLQLFGFGLIAAKHCTCNTKSTVLHTEQAPFPNTGCDTKGELFGNIPCIKSMGRWGTPFTDFFP